MKRLLVLLTKRRGDRRWDVLIRAAGTVALLGIPTVVIFPRLVPLVWLAVLAIPANSPLSPILPTAFEPLIMEAAKYEKAIWVTLVALTTYLYMEYLNWRLYSWVLNREVFARFKEHRWVRKSTRQFARSPFATVVFFAVSPLPFWVIRIVAIYHHYPLRSFMGATAIGRFPRLFAYAWLGELLRIPTVVLLGVIFGTAAVIIVYRLARGKRVLADTVLDDRQEVAVEERVEPAPLRTAPSMGRQPEQLPHGAVTTRKNPPVSPD